MCVRYSSSPANENAGLRQRVRCDTRTCTSLFIRVGRFIAKGASELQIATALTAELIGQMFNQETYGHC